MATASDRVWATYELLEMILLYLPPEHLFAVQRVCKTWRDIIGSSKKIRRLCFVEAEGQPVSPACWAEYRNISLKFNELLTFHTSRGPAYSCLRNKFYYNFLGPEGTTTTSTYGNLLLTQPPCTAVSVAATTTRYKAYFSTVPEEAGVNGVWTRKPARRYVTPFGLYRDKNGVRLGELQDWVAERISDANGEMEENVRVIVDVTLDTKFTETRGG